MESGEAEQEYGRERPCDDGGQRKGTISQGWQAAAGNRVRPPKPLKEPVLSTLDSIAQ